MKKINNLYAYLKNYTGNRLVISTAAVIGGWHDNEFDAHAAGFNIVRFQDPEKLAARKFAECYLLTRR